MSNWFYIQQWARRRWDYVGVEMPFQEAHRLFRALNSQMSERHCSPIALIRKGDNGKVIQKKSDRPEGWQEIMVNGIYLNDGKDEPLLVKRSES